MLYPKARAANLENMVIYKYAFQNRQRLVIFSLYFETTGLLLAYVLYKTKDSPD
jgi:hypothetical protein